MAISDNCRQSLIPSFLYSTTTPPFGFDTSSINANHHQHHHLLCRSPSVSPSPSTNYLGVDDAGITSGRILIPAPKEKIEMYSPAFYGACTMGGILSCGLTHTGVTPLDLVKCNMQVFFLHSSHHFLDYSDILFYMMEFMMLILNFYLMIQRNDRLNNFVWLFFPLLLL